MGLADVLFKLTWPITQRMVMMIWIDLQKFYHSHSMQESSKLAQDRGSYPLYNKDEFLNNFPVAGAQDYGWEYLKR